MSRAKESIALRDLAGGAGLRVKVVPGASRDKIVGVLGEQLKVTTTAPPEKGRANDAVATLLADAFDLASRNVELISPPGNPRKEFLLKGLSAEEARRRLPV